VRENKPKSSEEHVSRKQQYENLKRKFGFRRGIARRRCCNRNKKWERLTQEKREKTKAVPEFVTIVGTKVARIFWIFCF